MPFSLSAIALVTLLGCPYPSGDVWQTSIASAPVAPQSAAWLKAISDAGGSGSFTSNASKTDELINIADNLTPLVPVQPEVKWHTPYSPIPYESSFYIEPLSDKHILTLQTQACQYFEGYGTDYVNNVLSQYNGGMWNLRAAFARPKTGAISTASGIPIGLLAVRPEELTAGFVSHAIGWDAVANTLSQTACVSPAGETDCTDDLPYKGPSSDTPAPYGAHARLKASFNIASFPKEAKAVAQAMKTFGLYIYDTGCCNTVEFVNDQYGGPVWTSADSAALKTISPANFDFVSPP